MIDEETRKKLNELAVFRSNELAVFRSNYEGAAKILQEDEARGDALKKKAEKKLSGWGIFGSKYEDAAVLYFKAACCYEEAKTWEKAASAFMKLADIRILLEKKIEAATAYSSASYSYRNYSVSEAAQALNESIKILLETDRLDIASRYIKDLGELYVASHKFDKAMESFEWAADLFQEKEESIYLNLCKQRIAQVAAQLEQYPRAVEIYEEMARQPMDNSLLKCSVKAILLNAGICQLCKNDSVAITNSLEQYQEIDPTFSGTPEHKLLTDLATSMEEEDVEKFTAAINEYENMTHLDTWKKTLLSRVEAALKVEEYEDCFTSTDAIEEGSPSEVVGERGAESQVDEEVKNESDEEEGIGKAAALKVKSESEEVIKSQANEKTKKSREKADKWKAVRRFLKLN